MQIGWNDSLRIGVASIDSDHQLVFEMLDSLRSSINQHQEDAVVTSVLLSLEAYTESHFAREERIMVAVDYPNLVKHRADHQMLKDKMLVQYRMYNGNPHEYDAQSLMEFLNKWWVAHIEGADTKLKPYVLANLDKIMALGEVPIMNQDDIESEAIEEEWQWPT